MIGIAQIDQFDLSLLVTGWDVLWQLISYCYKVHQSSVLGHANNNNKIVLKILFLVSLSEYYIIKEYE